MAVEKQLITDEYALYCGDCMEVLPDLPDESVGFSIFSPPFCSLYSYSDSVRDMGNSKDYGEFFVHFGFLVDELKRLLMPGRVVAVHCMDLPTYKRDGEEIGRRNFPGDIVRCFEERGFIYHSRVAVWKNPLIAATRTKALGLQHKQIVKDSAMCNHGIADEILAFRKPGENPVPVSNEKGLTEYFGSRPVPNDLDRYIGHGGEQGKNKRSHWIWQQYASPVWFDVRQTRVLPFKQGREKDDERHIAPLQIDTVERCMVLWSAPGDIVLTPFMGVGTEVYVAVKNGRKGVGVELKRSYWRQAVKNVRVATREKFGDRTSTANGEHP